MISAGVYLIEKQVKEVVPKDSFFDAPDLFLSAKKSGLKVSIFPIYERWLDVGLPETFQRAINEW